MPDSERLTLEITLYNQILGCALLLVAIFGVLHNFFLSTGTLLAGPLPSTHPLTAAGFAILAAGIFFRPYWTRSNWVKPALCLTMILLSGVRIAEALFPDRIVFLTGGPVTEALESAHLYGRFSVETAIFLASCFCIELTQAHHTMIRLLLVSVCLAVLSLGVTETVYSIFLWGNELSLITQVAMWLMSVDLLVRMRRQQPFQSFLRVGRSTFYLQFTALALYLLPMIVGAVLLQEMHVSADQRIPFELAFAGSSCMLLGIVVLLGAYLDRNEVGDVETSPVTGAANGSRKSRDDNPDY